MKKAFLNVLYKTGGFTPFHRINRNKILILTYHRFSEEKTPFSVSRVQFDVHLAYLKKHQIILSGSEIYRCLQNDEKLPENATFLTIDDGYRDTYEIAYPLLKKHNIPATLFAVTDFLDRQIWIWTDKMRFITSRMKTEKSIIKIGKEQIELKNKTPEETFFSGSKVNSILKTLPDTEKDRWIEQIAQELKVELPDLPPDIHAPISWEQAREMVDGGVTVESHTMKHSILTNVCDDLLNLELSKSKQRLEEMLQREIGLFCYPAGAVDERVWQAVKRNGYHMALTSRYGFNTKETNPFLLKRIGAQPNASHFAQSVSGFEEFRRKFLKLDREGLDAE